MSRVFILVAFSSVPGFVRRDLTPGMHAVAKEKCVREVRDMQPEDGGREARRIHQQQHASIQEDTVESNEIR